MNTGSIIALAIVIVSIVLVVIVSVSSYHTIKPTLQNIKDLDLLIKHKKDLYTKEGTFIQQRVAQLNHDAELVQKELEEKRLSFQDFTHEQGEFQSSIRYLQNHLSDYSKGIAVNLKDEITEEGPKILESFKRTFKKTLQKQRRRRQIKKESRVIK